MSYLSLISGILLFVGVYIDFLYTTLSCNGSGKWTAFINKILARLWVPRNGSVVKNWIGLLHLFLTVFNWVLLLIAASVLIFSAKADWVVKSGTMLPADFLERLYFSVFTLSTLGVGDFVANHHISQLFSGFISVAGFGMLTMGITYLLSVTNAALHKKNLAAQIWSMGKSPIELFRYFTTGDNFKNFDREISGLIEDINGHSNQHLSFPIVHFFLSRSKSKSLAVQITSLYECLQKMKANFKDPNVRAEIERTEGVIADYLSMASTHLNRNRDEASLKKLREQFLNDRPHEEFPYDKEMVQNLSTLLDSQGWQYSEVYKVQG